MNSDQGFQGIQKNLRKSTEMWKNGAISQYLSARRVDRGWRINETKATEKKFKGTYISLVLRSIAVYPFVDRLGCFVMKLRKKGNGQIDVGPGIATGVIRHRGNDQKEIAYLTAKSYSVTKHLRLVLLETTFSVAFALEVGRIDTLSGVDNSYSRWKLLYQASIDDPAAMDRNKEDGQAMVTVTVIKFSLYCDNTISCYTPPQSIVVQIRECLNSTAIPENLQLFDDDNPVPISQSIVPPLGRRFSLNYFPQ
ncbi:hypothetical protein BDN72DRAFT_937811 [Pluteus cervinus]|uniref:Uncharacterized protein n=1 Tax=Pluteus cervinus TaxID=181527 RepID=A0ACD3A4W1_9AGAR|nr:hypothetical protein BDN72DRAFT_937811 [Pluteus cervinus]